MLTKLKPGDIAPGFETQDVVGNTIKLSDYAGKKLMIAFFRYAGCPWCNLAIFRLTQEYPKLHGKGLEIITFVQSNEDNITKNIKERHVPPPPFPLIADPEMRIYKLYGVKPSIKAAVKSISRIPAWFKASKKFPQRNVDGSLFLVPAEFLINPDQTIHSANYGSDYFDHTPFTEIYDFLIFGR